MVEQLFAVWFVMFIQNAERLHQILLKVEANVKVTGKSVTSPVSVQIQVQSNPKLLPV